MPAPFAAGFEGQAGGKTCLHGLHVEKLAHEAGLVNADVQKVIAKLHQAFFAEVAAPIQIIAAMQIGLGQQLVITRL